MSVTCECCVLSSRGLWAGHSSMGVLPRVVYRGADKSLARPGRKQATATEDFEFHISYF